MPRIQPDRAALEIAHRLLCVTVPLDEMLKSRAQQIILENVARAHIKRRDRLDVKKLQSNDHD
jgi:hypothetical protein